MNMIAAVDKNWAIGNKGSLLVRIPADQRLLRQETAGKVVVMGRKTLEGLPGGRPFDHCSNIVMSTDSGLTVRGAVVCHDLQELFEKLKGTDPDDVCVIGGGQIYRLLLPYCDKVHITRIEHAYLADTWFPNLDEDPEWHITADSDEMTYFDLEYRHLCYERR